MIALAAYLYLLLLAAVSIALEALHDEGTRP